ncbi:MAG: hypothetical protein Q9208_006928 [Pyrenodesmia sp. 3 TL-2023]
MAFTITLPRPSNPAFNPFNRLVIASPKPPNNTSTSSLVPSQDPHLLSLPSSCLKVILTHLLTSPDFLILHRDSSTPATYSTNLTTAVLLLNRHIYHTALPILYGRNTFTASTAATSYDFDAHVLNLPGRLRGMIKNVELQINWGERLWMKLPLLAARLQELKGLKSLKLHVVVNHELENRKEADSEVTRQGKGGAKEMAIKREGQAAEAMLKAEKKVLRELVLGLKGLRVFELNGFVEGEFARSLEVWVKDGRKA